ncbi:hypothetical protein Zmor_019639 [Zophobas morio]|uniref:Uncharacterized protein n=1 Tax=Zophobas morio TaxID=2755281 RepID=A0AA38I1Z4_9CUCU|nr:hypothetical protein Zmor_019639 [Zophobas morio]
MDQSQQLLMTLAKFGDTSKRRLSFLARKTQISKLRSTTPRDDPPDAVPKTNNIKATTSESRRRSTYSLYQLCKSGSSYKKKHFPSVHTRHACCHVFFALAYVITSNH